MKDAQFTIEFLSHCLANGGDPDAGIPDRFQRDAANHIVMQQCWFHSAFTRAIPLARLQDDVTPTEIQIELTVTAPTVMHERRFGEGMVRTHEAVMAGTQVKFNAMVADHVTRDMLYAVLDRMGKYVGLSPYGFKLGLGKFNVIDVTVQEE